MMLKYYLNKLYVIQRSHASVNIILFSRGVLLGAIPETAMTEDARYRSSRRNGISSAAGARARRENSAMATIVTTKGSIRNI